MEQLSHILDSNKQNIYKLEKGLYCPTIATLFFISESLGCSIFDIIPKPFQ